MFNFGEESYTISDNDRIAQLVISALPQVKFKIVEHLDVTERGSGGYGASGRDSICLLK